ncbi:hypothetical protein PLUTE_a0954 [Pseudoalteromonas luteoviolacea DSM 6061]|nr:hypothetical protein [Pseudoalteromonas luteoviolacea DSM 6061]
MPPHTISTLLSSPITANGEKLVIKKIGKNTVPIICIGDGNIR